MHVLKMLNILYFSKHGFKMCLSTSYRMSKSFKSPLAECFTERHISILGDSQIVYYINSSKYGDFTMQMSLNFKPKAFMS